MMTPPRTEVEFTVRAKCNAHAAAIFPDGRGLRPGWCDFEGGAWAAESQADRGQFPLVGGGQRALLRHLRRCVRAAYFFTFFGSQSFFFLDDTKPHSLHRQSPGFALRIGFPF